MSQQLKKKLEQNIWMTRKCRINASERLLSHAKFIEFLNVYYSIFVLILSLISLTNQNNLLSTISLALSIALTISIIYANATGYRERSSILKQNYIDMQLLLDQLSCIDDDDADSVNIISVKYAELLKTSENHMPIDMYKVKADSTDPNLVLSKKEKRVYFFQVVLRYLWQGLFILIPIAATFANFFLR